MEMTKRKEKILAAVVELYIKNGEPVGSKALMGELDFSVSSATIRNEMSELAEMGYLDQPHTSAGRVPTHKGYRYYVDKLMSSLPVNEEDRRNIESGVTPGRGDPEILLERASEVLAEITNCAAISATPTSDMSVIRKVEFVPVSNKTAMIVMLTSAGILKSRACRSDTPITPEMVEKFYQAAAVHFINKPVDEIGTGMLQTMVASLGEFALSLSPFFVALADLARDTATSDIMLEGQQNLFQHRELTANAIELVELLRRSDKVNSIIRSGKNGFEVKIGSENEYKPLENTSVIVSHYDLNGNRSGAIGLIGPTRIDYARLIPSMKFLTSLVGKLLNEAFDE